MDARISHERVKGFLNVDGKKLVNGDGEEVLLFGVGLGNWLFQEPYMWQCGFAPCFSAYKRMWNTIRLLCGKAYTDHFWKTYFETYISREDIRLMAEYGFNSLRIPFNSYILTDEDPDLKFNEEIFGVIDNVISWCKEFKMWAIIDMHATPGGHSGAEDGDYLDLGGKVMTDPICKKRAIDIWKEIARRYKDNPTLAMYDILNEPASANGLGTFVPELAQFYDDCIAGIREIDKKTLISIESLTWASDPFMFFKKYDDKMVAHFHRYGVTPAESNFTPFLEVRDRLNVPLLLGECGENCQEWIATEFNIANHYDISTNFWTWKKTYPETDEAEGYRHYSNLMIRRPKDWSKFAKFVENVDRANRPSPEEARAMFDEFLENIKAENCDQRKEITNSLFRRAPFIARATDFDTDGSFGRHENGPYHFRKDKSMGITLIPGQHLHRPPSFNFFNTSYQTVYRLEMIEGEWANYTVRDVKGDLTIELTGSSEAGATFELSAGKEASKVTVPSGEFAVKAVVKAVQGDTALKVACTGGKALLGEVKFL